MKVCLNVRSLAWTQVAVDDILKDFETVDYFHGEHPGVMHSCSELYLKSRRPAFIPFFSSN